MANDTQRPLSGIRVVGLEQYMAGPYCTLLLADAGAEVIKIERPGSGDPRRQMPPFATKGERRKAAGFMGYNRNKKSLALDLRSGEGQEIFRKLVRTADVVVENLRPGATGKIGLGHKEMRALNPRLVWAIISGFGQLEGYRGPYSDRPAFDIVGEAMSGIMHQVGFADKPPSWTIYGMADIYSGLATAYGVMQALFLRERTGQGQLVDSAILDNMLGLNEAMFALYSVSGQVPERGKPRNLWPRGAFETRDGYVALNVPDNIIWSRLCKAMGREDLIEDERALSGTARSANVEFLQPVIEGWLAALGRDEAVDTLNAIGVPCGPVYTAEDVFADPHVKARGMIMPIADPEFGTFGFARSTPHLSSAPELPANPAPDLGQHTREILEGLLGYTSKDVDHLAADGVVQTDGA
ncbi:MAG: CoA transferase [Rhodospirillales bacterium]|nr:CoA transferase [Rhodospirillales bacterium]MDH3917315.1 CoA transferase [Rhodospirillales bacterium]MDH3967041.1 CoA transferase [Rhodospirillales bacterium]